jgi:DNA-binding MarR family transcriptional regulator
MNKQATHHSLKRVTRTQLELTNISAQTATETIYKVAEVARTLKYATHAMEKVVHVVSGTNEHLTLLHWLVLARLSGTPTCKQMELKSDTKIAAAYLTRLLDDLVREGLVRRHRSSSDRRQILLTLTERGRTATLELLTTLNDVARPSQLNAIEHLSASLEHFVSLATEEGWFGIGA